MKILLVGSPGAGKTKLARGLAKKLGENWKVIDGYVDRLAKRTGNPYGPYCNYALELEVIGVRWSEEDAVSNKGMDSITVGSIYDSIIYATSVVPDQSSEQAMMEDVMMKNIMMQSLGALQKKTFDYTFVFFLPNPALVGSHTWDEVLNAKLPDLLYGMNIEFIELEADISTKEQIESAYGVIERFIALTTPALEQSV
jgi:hypothetical protein